MHLLLIDDNPDLVANVADALEGRSHTLDIADNGHARLGFALEHDYDALNLALTLPGIDGFEVCTRLRSAGRSLPVLMLTARDGSEDKLECFSSGADDCLLKPSPSRSRTPACSPSCAAATPPNPVGRQSDCGSRTLS